MEVGALAIWRLVLYSNSNTPQKKTSEVYSKHQKFASHWPTLHNVTILLSKCQQTSKVAKLHKFSFVSTDSFMDLHIFLYYTNKTLRFGSWIFCCLQVRGLGLTLTSELNFREFWLFLQQIKNTGCVLRKLTFMSLPHSLSEL